MVPEAKELGFVGIPKKIDSSFLINEIKKNYIPIISPLGLDKDHQTYNINGDTAAGAIAKSLKSRRLLLMTNVEGVLDKEKKLIEEISSSEILEMIKSETITEGMIPKVIRQGNRLTKLMEKTYGPVMVTGSVENSLVQVTRMLRLATDQLDEAAAKEFMYGKDGEDEVNAMMDVLEAEEEQDLEDAKV